MEEVKKDSPANHRPEYSYSSLLSLQLVKKQQDKQEASPEDTYTAKDLLNSVHYCASSGLADAFLRASFLYFVLSPQWSLT